MNVNEEELFQTSCTECSSVFNLNKAQLLAADGRVRCSECDEIFDANIHLASPNLNPSSELPVNEETEAVESAEHDQATTVSLTEAMNEGQILNTNKSLRPIIWALGISLLMGVSSLQWLYFDRHQLIKNPSYQSYVLSLCQYLSCDNAQFKNTDQFTLIERNIFTHPTQANALLISGSFINEAPFAQQTPQLKVSLFNLQGDIIAQRHFSHQEYNQSPEPLETIASGESIHFNLEVEDPNTVTITYEFEFI